MKLDGGGAPVEDGDLDAELVAGDDGLAKAGVIDAGEDHELGVAIVLGEFCEQKRAAGLRDGFDDENSGHDGKVRKMASEVRLVDGDVLDGDDAGFALHLEDAIDEEKRVTMRQDGHDLLDVQGVCGG